MKTLAKNHVKIVLTTIIYDRRYHKAIIVNPPFDPFPKMETISDIRKRVNRLLPLAADMKTLPIHEILYKYDDLSFVTMIRKRPQVLTIKHYRYD